MAIVKIEPSKSDLLLSCIKKDGSGHMRTIPKGKYWSVVWVRKPKGMDKGITGYFPIKVAEKIAEAINSLDEKIAKKMIHGILSHGSHLQREHSRKWNSSGKCR